MQLLHIKVEFIEELLGTASSNPDIHHDFIASKSGEPFKVEDEVAAIGVEDAFENSMTVFPRLNDGTPFLWDYQWKGYFKDCCGMLRRASGMKSSKLTAYKKVIDGLVFAQPRKIPLFMPEGMSVGRCRRPLRATTPQGERVALSTSETVPAGTVQVFDVLLLDDKLDGVLLEWLDYGKLHGTGQWRNSGKGRFLFQACDENGELLSGNM